MLKCVAMETASNGRHGADVTVASAAYTCRVARPSGDITAAEHQQQRKETRRPTRGRQVIKLYYVIIIE